MVANEVWYLMVPPLPVGSHVIHFSGVLPDSDPAKPPLRVDVTDTIAVVPAGSTR